MVQVKNARFTVITPECIRLEYSPLEKFVDDPSLFAAVRGKEWDQYVRQENGTTTSIDTGRIVLHYTPDGKPFHAENLRAVIKKGNEKVEWKPGMKNSKNLGGTLATLDEISGTRDLGEGLLSCDGWYLLDDSAQFLFKDGWVQPRQQDGNLDWYLFGYGFDFKSALKALTAIGGKVPLPRKYVLGSWYSRWWDYTSKDFRDIVEEYKRHDFPLDILVMDMGWHKQKEATVGHGWASTKGWTGWSWNRELLPDAEKLLAWLHQRRLYVTLNVHPHDGVRTHEDCYASFMRMLKRDPSSGENLPFDAGNKDYMNAYFKAAHEPLERSGVDFWWVDWQQDRIYPSVISVPGLAHLRWLNHCYYQHTSKNNKRGLSFSRWAGWGDHRHPIQFSGDARSFWEMLAFEVHFTATAGNVGCFFWSHDMGGFTGKRDPEMYSRWVQFGVTTVALRIHSTRSKDLDRRPWKWGKQAENSIRKSFHLRSQLMPYIYSSVWQCHKAAVPLNRPLYLEYPEFQKAYENQQEYLFGDNFLCAPITSAGNGTKKISKQKVWFPPKTTWYNYFTHEKYEGESEQVIQADINSFPLFVKAGVPIPMQPYTDRMSSTPLKRLIIRCYPGIEGQTSSYDLYEDDGVSQDYLKGKFAITQISYTLSGDIVTILVASTKGSFKGQERFRSYEIELPCIKKAEKIEVDGKSRKAIYDKILKGLRMKIPARSIKKTTRIAIKLGKNG